MNYRALDGIRFNFKSNLVFVAIFLLPIFSFGQIEVLPCQTEADATLDLDRKDWNMGSTVFHSEASMHNFQLPDNTYGPCKLISSVTFDITVNSIDFSNMPPDCPIPTIFFINITEGCPSFVPASCDLANLIDEIGAPLNLGTTSFGPFTNPPNDIAFGEVFGVDIVPVMDTGCSVGQSALSSGSIILDYEVCVTITISDDVIDTPPDLGSDQTICPTSTTTLDPGAYDMYDWGPGGETSPTITVGPGNYTVTVTDSEGCTGEDAVTILPFPDSDITFDPIDPSVCDNGMVEVSVNESYTNYNWSSGDMTQSVMLTTGSYDVTITDGNGCTNVESITVDNVDPPNAGIDNFLDACNDGTTYDLEALLLAHDAGGSWSDDNASGVDVNASPTAVDFDGVAPGTYNFTYTVDGVAPCPQDQAMITVEVFDQSNAGTSNTEQFCGDPGFLDFYLLINNPDTNGDWDDLDFTGVDLSNPFAVNLDGLPIGTYNFEYTIPQNGACPEQSSTLTIVIEQGAEAGADNFATVCEGSQFDLQTLVNGANNTGVFVDTDASGALTGSIVNTTGLAGQVFNFTFVVGSPMDPCGEDQAILTLSIENSLSAGDDASDAFCTGDEINLLDILANEDAGGTFSDIDNSGGLTGNILDTENISPGTYTYQYEVGDGVTCPQDVSEITLTFFDDPNYVFNSPDITLCENQCDSIEIIFSGSPPFNFPIELYATNGDSLILTDDISISDFIYTFTTCNVPGGITFSNDTITLENDSSYYLIIPSINDLNCSAESGNGADTLFINTLSYSSFDLDTTACITDTVEINGVLLFYGNASYTDTIPGMACDSIININVTFTDADTIFNTPTICPGDSIQLYGFWFDEAIPGLEFTIQNPDGCDSVIVVDVSFYEVADTLLDLQLCSGDSIVVNGVTYNEMNASGTEVLEDQSVNGCDSIIMINIMFADDIQIIRNDTLCPDESITIGNETFDIGNATGTVSLTGTGCDTLVTVDLSFYETADTVISGEFCPDFSVEVDGFTFDINNPSGSATLFDASQNGCDSIITIALSFYEEAESSIIGTFCPDFEVEVNGVLYNESNPFGTEIIANASQNGCDSTVVIDLVFFTETTEDYFETICDNESIIINNTEYNSSNTTGTEIFVGGAANGCDSIVNVSLTVLNAFNITASEEICDGDSIFLEGSWQFDPGMYVDSLQSADLCDSIITTTLTVITCEFIVNVSTENNVCTNGTSGSILLQILTGFDPNAELSWTGLGTGTTGTYIIEDPAESNVGIPNLPSDDYIVRITDANGVLLWEETISIIDAIPQLIGSWNLLEPIDCFGEEGAIEFEVSGGTPTYSYTWSNSSIGDTSLVEEAFAGLYMLTVTDINGCTLETSYEFMQPSELSLTIDIVDASCAESSDGQLQFTEIAGGTSPYTITINGLPQDSFDLENMASGEYDIVVVDGNFCDLNTSETIAAEANPTLATYTDTYSIELGEEVTFEASDLDTTFRFEWINNTAFLSCTDCPLPTANPQSTQIYDLVVTDQNGCTQSISILVEVTIPEVVDVLPNIFSPNGDNNNDEFRVIINDPAAIGLGLEIFDRWGNKMFQGATSDNEISWDGRKGNTLMAPGVYVYKLIIEKTDGSSEIKLGDVLIIN